MNQKILKNYSKSKGCTINYISIKYEIYLFGMNKESGISTIIDLNFYFCQTKMVNIIIYI